MLILKNITKKYSSIIIFHNKSDIYKKGNIYFLSGNSGTGKTTYLNIIAGLTIPDNGEVLYNNNYITFYQHIYLKDIVSYIEQNPTITTDMTTIDIVMYIKKYNNDYDEIMYNELLLLLDIKDIIHKYIWELSGGQTYRIALLIALLKKHEILLLDEPTAHIQENIAHNIMSYIKKHTIKNNIITIISTHDSLILNYADYIILFT